MANDLPLVRTHGHSLIPTRNAFQRVASTAARWIVVALVVLLAGCSGDSRERLLVYTPHGRDQLELLERAFEAKHPDVDLRWLDMGSQEILDRLRFERQSPQADVWFGGPSTIFDRGIRDSLLAPYRPAWASAVGDDGIGPRDLYYPAYRTPAVIAYNTAALAPEDAPQDWDDVLEARWAGKVLIRDPMASGTMRAIWGLIIQRSITTTGDTTAGMAWLRRLDANTKTYTLNPAILVEKLTRQEGLVTLWDLQDILINRSKGAPFGYVFPKSGTVVIEDAIGLVRGARHPNAAKRFIDFVGSKEAQLLTARGVFRVPARHDLPLDSMPDWVSDVERDMVVANVDWGMLAHDGPAWMSYWDQHVRGTGKSAAKDVR
ncbi:MAG: extracellular solute-binding protein [Gemmatimonadales bacterium]|jgi:iron(III) transport system substrate-binding protein|nr:MAG: extracellular solute-binding protein [Gemmatimonadales bacterium]